MSQAKAQLAVDLSNKGAALLKRLQSEDEHVAELLCHASHTALYKYNPPEKSWERLGVEGPLVIVRRSGPPYTQMIILNRLSRDNYVVDTSSIIRTKSQDPYLMLQLMRGATSKLVLGCWFYGSEEREEVRRMLDAVLDESDKTTTSSVAASSGSRQSSRGSTAAAAPAPTSTPGGDRASGQQILQLLRKDGSRQPSPISTTAGTSNNSGANNNHHATEPKKKASKSAAAAAAPAQASPDDLLTPSQVLGVPYKFAQRAALTRVNVVSR